MSRNIVTLLEAITDRECQAYTSSVSSNPQEIFDAHTETISEMEFLSLVETKMGDFAFRNVNGVAITKLPEYDLRRFTPSIGNPHLDLDIALYDTMMARGGGKAGNMIVSLKQGIVSAVYDKLGKQFYYGDSTGYGISGIQNQIPKDLTFHGGGNSDGSMSSIYFLRFGIEDISVTYGGGIGKNFTFSPFQERIVQTMDGEATHMWSYFRMYPMVTVSRVNCCARICNVGTTVTDAMLQKALAHCAENAFVPDCIYMRPMTLEYLRESRTATNPTGAPAPTPDACGQIPIKTTLSLSNMESLVASTNYSAL